MRVRGLEFGDGVGRERVDPVDRAAVRVDAAGEGDQA